MGAVSVVWRRERILRDPHGAAAWLNSGVVYGGHVSVLSTSVRCVVFTVVFKPPPVRSLAGYPIETARVVVMTSGDPLAIPGGARKTWRHKYPCLAGPGPGRIPQGFIPFESLVGALCLWYPKDPPALRWDWSKGLDDYVRVVQRHLWCEEFFRRNLRWPGEETPHGERADGQPHPIFSENLRDLTS